MVKWRPQGFSPAETLSFATLVFFIGSFLFSESSDDAHPIPSNHAHPLSQHSESHNTSGSSTADSRKTTPAWDAMTNAMEKGIHEDPRVQRKMKNLSNAEQEDALIYEILRAQGYSHAEASRGVNNSK